MRLRLRKKEQSASSASPKKSGRISRLLRRKKSTPSAPPVQAPVSVVQQPKPKRQAPQVVQFAYNAYRDVLRIFDPVVGALCFMILVTEVVWIKKFNAEFSLKGLAAGVVLVLVELLLFAMLDRLHYAANAKPEAKRVDLFIMSLVGLVMLAAVGYVVYRWLVLVPSILFVVAFFLIFPGVLVSMHDSNIKQDIEAQAKADAFAAVAAERAGLEEKEALVDRMLRELHQVNEAVIGVLRVAGDNADKAATAAAFASRLASDIPGHIKKEGAVELESAKENAKLEVVQAKQRLEAQLSSAVQQIDHGKAAKIDEQDARIQRLEAELEDLRSGAPSFMDDDYPDSDASRMTVRSGEDD